MRFMRMAGLVGILTALLGGQPGSANTKDGIAAYKRGDYPRAMKAFETASRAGDANADYNLGVAHAEGKAVPQDWPTALAAYERAARKGNALAAFNLGQAYRKGQGTAVDYAQAAQWYKSAAQSGHYHAANELGLLYVEGKGVARDPVEGFAWIYPATHAEIMDATAMANAMKLAGMLTREQVQAAQARGQSYYKRYMAPNQTVVRALLAQ